MNIFIKIITNVKHTQFIFTILFLNVFFKLLKTHQYIILGSYIKKKFEKNTNKKIIDKL